MNLLPFHLGFMTAACVLMLTAVSAARFLKGNPRWLKLHKAIDFSSLACLVIGLTLGVIMTNLAGESEAGAPHRILGGVSIGLAACLALIGFSIFRLKGKDAISARKRLHRWLGRLEALCMVGAAVLGLFLVGIL